MIKKHLPLILAILTTLSLSLGCGTLAQPNIQSVNSPLPSPTPTRSWFEAETSTGDWETPPSKVLEQATPTIVPTVKLVTPRPRPSPVPPVLQITLDKSKLGPPVKEVIYHTTNPSPDPQFERISQIWRADINNINAATLVMSITHKQDNFLDGLALSPDANFLVYGQDYNKRTHTKRAWLYNIGNSHLQAIDQDIMLSASTKTFIWATDSQSLIYKKSYGDFPTELYQYNLKTGQATLLLKTDWYITLIAWQDDLIYYLLSDFNLDYYTMYAYNLEIKQTEAIYNFDHRWPINQIRLSPDGRLAQIDSHIIDLEAKLEIGTQRFSRSLWFPDNQGTIAIDDGLQRSVFEIKTFKPPIVEALSLSIKQPTTNIELIVWSPDGLYLIYRPYHTNTYYLLNIASGQLQTVTPTSFFKVIGWLN